MKFGKTRQCPKCKEEIRNKSGVLTDHFKEKHPEYKFQRRLINGQRALVCDICHQPANSFSRLIEYHGHHVAASSEPAPIAFPYRSLLEFGTSLVNLMDEVVSLREENNLLRAEKGALEHSLEKRTAQVIAAQNALADIK